MSVAANAHVCMHKVFTVLGRGYRDLWTTPIEAPLLDFDGAFRPDLIVENAVVVEIKSVGSLAYVHEKQIITYLKLLDLRLGLILNFGAGLMKMESAA